MTIDNLGINQLLQAHNDYRSDAGVGLSPLTWSQTLANSAQNWSNHLANVGRLEHSDSEFGENIWMGTSGFYSFPEMVDSWGEEKEYFIPGSLFPDVSTTGDWSDVGHYTQIVWEDTTELGCGLSTGGGNDYLTCQYDPAGNIFGQRVYDPNVDPPPDVDPPPPVEPNNTIAQATDTSLSGSETYNISAEIDPQNDVDLFAVQLDAGDQLTADIDAQSIGSSLDPILTVFDSEGTLVAQNDDSDGLDSFIDFTANSAGNYYVGVSSYGNSDYNPSVEGSSSGFSSGSYDLSLSICCDGSPDPAQSLDRLTPVDVQVAMLPSGSPQTFSDSVGDTDIVDTYAFSVRDFGPDSIYLPNISLTGLSNDADIRLIEDYNSNGIVDVDLDEVLGSSTNGGSLDESIVIGLDGGDYFLQVYQYSGDTNYQLTFA